MTRDEIAAELEKRIGRIAVERDRQNTFGGFRPLSQDRLIELRIYEHAYLWAHSLLTNRNSLGEQCSRDFLVNGARASVRQYETAISWGNERADRQNSQDLAVHKEIVSLFEALKEDESV
jgi:hypothetical protein